MKAHHVIEPLVALAIIGVIAAIAIPSLLRARETMPEVAVAPASEGRAFCVSVDNGPERRVIADRLRHTTTWGVEGACVSLFLGSYLSAAQVAKVCGLNVMAYPCEPDP